MQSLQKSPSAWRISTLNDDGCTFNSAVDEQGRPVLTLGDLKRRAKWSSPFPRVLTLCNTSEVQEAKTPAFWNGSQVPADAIVEQELDLGSALLRLLVWQSSAEDPRTFLVWAGSSKSPNKHVRLTAFRKSDDDLKEPESVFTCELPPRAVADLLCSFTGACTKMEEARTACDFTWTAEVISM